MLKQSLFYLLLSIVIVIFAAYIHLLIIYIDLAYTYVSIKLAPVFSLSPVGVMARNVFTLVVIPVLLAGIPALIYRLIKGKHMPWFIPLVWFFWLVIVLSKVLIR